MNKFFYLLLLTLSNNFYSINTFNINSLSSLSRKEVFESFSKIIASTALIKPNYNNQNTNYNLNAGSDVEDILINVIDNNIYFYSPITKLSCFKLEKEIILLNRKNLLYKKELNIDNGPINLHIQSNGGSLLHAIYITDLIKNLETPVYTYIDGFSASAATIISVVGKKRYMTKNSVMLIHQLSSGMQGKFYEMEDENENLNNLMKYITNIYIDNSKINEDLLSSILKRDIWLNSTFCLENGLIDEII